MVQALFFISLLSIAAMLLVLFWYLDDSYEEEYAMNCKRSHDKSFNRVINCRPSFLHQEDSLIKYSPLPKGSPGIYYNLQKVSCRKNKITFYDVGMEEEIIGSSTENQVECA